MELTKNDIMKILKLILAVGMLLAMYVTSRAQDGEQLFKGNCASCHKLGVKLVGPDLIGVNDKRSEEWLLKWVKSSQAMVKAGDPEAVKLYNDNNKIPMTDAFINEGEIKAVLGYIKTKGDEMASAGGSTQTIAITNAATGSITPSVNEPNVNLLNMFSRSEYLLISLCFILLIIVWMMSKTIRSLSAELERKYNSDDYL